MDAQCLLSYELSSLGRRDLLKYTVTSGCSCPVATIPLGRLAATATHRGPRVAVLLLHPKPALSPVRFDAALVPTQGSEGSTTLPGRQCTEMPLLAIEGAVMGPQQTSRRFTVGRPM
jgi:hypothetical protein